MLMGLGAEREGGEKSQLSVCRRPTLYEWSGIEQLLSCKVGQKKKCCLVT